jgi:hypothetical protein
MINKKRRRMAPGGLTKERNKRVPAKQIGEAHGDTSPEEGESSVEVGILGYFTKVLDLALENDGNDDTVDGHGFAENDTVK